MSRARMQGRVLGPMLVLACAQVACTRREVIEVARVASTVAAVAAWTAAKASLGAESGDSSDESVPSAPWDSDACPNSECYVDTGAPLDRARLLAVDLINQERAARGLPSLGLDGGLCDGAQASSRWLALDRHYTYDHEDHYIYDEDNRRSVGIEIQFDANGYGDPTMDIETQVVGALSAMIREGHGGSCRDNLLSPRWRRVGVGLSNPDGLLYLSLDFAD